MRQGEGRKKRKHAMGNMSSASPKRRTPPPPPQKQTAYHKSPDANVTVVGLISDTHGVLDHPTLDALKTRSTATVIHAGDVGDCRRKSRLSATQVIDRLANETGKAVIAVSGNVDEGVTDLPVWRVVTISGLKILTVHICGFPPNICKESQQIIDAVSPHVVIFGHSHVPGAQWHDNVLFVNPGSAGPRRFKLPRCVAFLSINATGETEVEFIPVANLPQDASGLPPSFSVKM